MSMLWDDPDTFTEEDDFISGFDSEEDAIVFEDSAREAAAEAAMWERPRGLSEWDADPEDDF